ncbi:MAG: hypothetical protein KIS96_11510 [Bauldia sp.]|nr:hypothetical protein [Bauldia sp.]
MARLALENIPGERAVLGAALRDPGIFWQHRARFRPEIFVGKLHSRIVAVMNKLADSDREIASPAILGFLAVDEDDGVSPEGYLATLMTEEADNALAADLLDDLSETWARRQMATFGEALLKESTKDSRDSAIERLDRAVATVKAIAETLDSDRVGSADAAIDRMIAQVVKAHQVGHSDGIPWFLPELQRITGDDLEFSRLIGLLADTAGGKTSLMLQQAAKTAETGVPVLVLSGDQTPEECYMQIASQALGIESAALRKGQFTSAEFSQIETFTRGLKRLPIEIRRIFRPSTRDISNMVRSFVRRRGRGLVAIDHAKRVVFDDRRAGISEGVNQVFGDLKALMGATGCVGLVLMQRNSEGNRRDDPRPMLGDIYGGMGAAESFDTVIALYVEERFLALQMKNGAGRMKSEQWDRINARLNNVRGKAELIGLKVRFGPPDLAEHVEREARFTRFVSSRAAQPEFL